MKWAPVLYLLGLFSSSAYCYADQQSFRGGMAVPVTDIRKTITTAEISTTTEWCTPAVQIGPRVFITAAHCAKLLEGQKVLKIIGPGIQTESGFRVISTPSLSDEVSFSAPNCRSIFDGLKDGDTLTKQQMLDCWANDGQTDLAVLVIDADISGPMLSISSSSIASGEQLSLLGEAPACGGDFGFYRTTSFRVFGFNHSQVVLDGAEQGYPAGDSSACGGDSGGIYYREYLHSGVEVVAIHSAGTREQEAAVTINGKKVILPLHLSGGTDLTDPVARNWLKHNAESNRLSICGINISCPKFEF